MGETIQTTTGQVYITGTTGAFTATGAIQGTEELINSAAGANSRDAIMKTITAIADASATTILTVTVPNGNHAAAVRLLLLSNNGSTDAYESVRAAQGLVVIQRNTGAAAAATAAAIADGVIATNVAGGSATHTLAYSIALGGEGVGSTNTVLIKVTIDDTGNLGANQLVVFAELINAAASGITIA